MFDTLPKKRFFPENKSLADLVITELGLPNEFQQERLKYQSETQATKALCFGLEKPMRAASEQASIYN